MKENKYSRDYAFEMLMKENDPVRKKHDSCVEGILPECRTCRFHRPNWKYETCVYKSCPYSLEKVSTRRKDRGDECAK